MATVARCYGDLGGFKAVLGVPSTTTTFDAALYRELLGASLSIDERCHRTFRIHKATLYLNPDSARVLDLGEHGLLSIDASGLATDDGSRDYTTTWAATDYDLEPANAAEENRPYEWVEVSPKGRYEFPKGLARGVRLAATLGWWAETEATGATCAEAVDTSETEIDISDYTLLAVGQTLLVDSEQMHVTALTNAATDTMTVLRGVNGTTAASHLTAAAISRYAWPRPIVEATYALAGRVGKRLANPTGIITAPEGEAVRMSGTDPIFDDLLRRGFVRVRI